MSRPKFGEAWWLHELDMRSRAAVRDRRELRVAMRKLARQVDSMRRALLALRRAAR